MKLLSLLNVFKIARELAELKEKYGKLEAEFEALNEHALDQHFEFQMYKNEMEGSDEDPDPLERYHRKCSCGGTIMPTYYEAPHLDEFCNRQCGYFA